MMDILDEIVGTLGDLLFFVYMIIVYLTFLATMPLWIIPYKIIKIKKRRGK